MKFQIDEAKRVVRAKTPCDAIKTLPELDYSDDGFIFNITTIEHDAVWEVKVTPPGKTFTVRVTESLDYEDPKENNDNSIDWM